MAKVPRSKIPLRAPRLPKVDPGQLPYMAMDDLDQVKQLVESGDEAALTKFINDKLLPYERNYPDQAGVATRTYLDSLLGSAVTELSPEIFEASRWAQFDPNATKELTKLVRDRVYPGMTGNITSDNELGDEYNHETDTINIDPAAPRNKKIGTILHEYGHNLDNIRRDHTRGKEHPALIAKKSAYTKVLKDELDRFNTTQGEGGDNRPTPNFQDYDWQAGDFNSDVMRDPLDIQDEEARAHHLNRNYPLDNLKNVIKGGLDEIVDATPDKFNKLRNSLRGRA